MARFALNILVGLIQVTGRRLGSLVGLGLVITDVQQQSTSPLVGLRGAIKWHASGPSCQVLMQLAGFLLPTHALKVGFYLPPYSFFSSLLKDYKIAPGQLSSFSWWIAMVYFIECSRHGDQESGVKLFMFTVGADNRLIGGVDIAHIFEESLAESTSLSKEIDEYMDVQSFMQNVQRSPTAFARKGSDK
ncbi:hypothetical protein J1N35_028691 [Gossypium stocksii]|uniref:Uncharacterized protein n=1 Tax=Gossypium stocksii TaxID=47602 RepID=A0A9D3UX80_9ROSI|nr:hypothetical protein J1N35_028691 [Gossypium stocksii]